MCPKNNTDLKREERKEREGRREGKRERGEERERESVNESIKGFRIRTMDIAAENDIGSYCSHQAAKYQEMP